MSRYTPKIIVTSGEPAGIGPDVCLHLLNAKLPAQISVLGDSVVFGQRAEQLGLQKALKNLNLISVPTAYPVQAGRLNVDNAPMVIKQLDLALEACVRKQFDAMVTAPLHKGIINDSGLKFSGHTEYLAQKTQTEKPVMMLACEAMRVALVTTHLPLADVSKAITQENLLRTLEILYNDLRLRFGIESPTIAVCGLNPHAGEQGHLGKNEIEVIEPSLDLARQSGYDILGPLPADTAFTPRILDDVDAVLCMYHDQGLPVLKFASFGKGTNITLGLPIIRTSVDHGTALDLAGTGRIEPGSMIAAVETAIEMAHIAYARKHAKKKSKKQKKQKQKSSKNEEANIDLSAEAFSEIFNSEMPAKQKEKKSKKQTQESSEKPNKQDPSENQTLENDGKTLIFREQSQRDMEMESTMTATIDKTVKNMKSILT